MTGAAEGVEVAMARVAVAMGAEEVVAFEMADRAASISVVE